MAVAGRKHAGAPCPAPGAMVTSRSSRSAIAGTSAVSAADSASHPGAAGNTADAVAAGSAIMCAVIAVCPFRTVRAGGGGGGSDTGTECQRGNGFTEGDLDGGGHDVAVLFRGGADQVPGGGVGPQHV